ncbi:uncharacterized protein LOC142098421 [Mixophyes fleayi]|uniref:uncharacterized protein LOC142098421 n=1 Tax=Mixophyes fleayi TaxID=3061075 RepID=UPI003F4E226C
MDEISKMTEYITNFSLNDCPKGNRGFTRVLIQLFGFLGHGKSSFINSCKYVLEDGEFKTIADVTLSDGGNTMARITYPLTKTLTLVDNRGCSTMKNYEVGEIYGQIGNLLPLDAKVEWSKNSGLMEKIVDAEKLVQGSDFIYPVFVYSVKKGISVHEVEELKELLTAARNLTGKFPMVVLTHRTHLNFNDVKKKFENMGVKQIMPIECFTPEDHLKTRGKHENILEFFIEVIKDVTFRLEHPIDPEAERKKRKKFVLNYIYENELKKKNEAFERNLEIYKGRYLFSTFSLSVSSEEHGNQRNINQSNMDEIPKMTEYITNFSLDKCSKGNRGFIRVLIQLFGFLGHGKSSFINSCKYVLEDGEYKTYADVREIDGGNTMKRITYPLTKTLTLVDNRGCSIMNNYEVGEIYGQIGNLLTLDVKVEWSKNSGLMEKIVDAEKSVKDSDFMYPVFVYSVKKGISIHEVKELKELLTTARNLTGIFPMVVLTHRTHSNFDDVRNKFENMGVERIMPIECFTPEDHLKTRGKHENILKIFVEMIKDITFRLEHPIDPEAERKQRKTFVFKYIPENTLKKENEAFKRNLKSIQN